ncbi:MAG: hypothetical protein WD823_11260 [Sulfuricaulis sp.]|uniref:hypothetical protein n=1 Tax=Sulfuricaulis sp. TaxID=2003553 RepID=UPI0034A1C02C
MRQTTTITTLLAALVVGISAGFIYLLSITNFIGLRTAFVLLTSLLLIYLALEVNRVRRLHPVRWLINPAVLCSLMVFVLGFGVTNFMYFLPEDILHLVWSRREITASMNKLMLLAIIGAVAMWLGYWSPLVAKLMTRESLIGFRKKFFVFNAEPKAWVLVGLVLTGLASRFIQIQLGLFGYSSTYDRHIEAASYTQYLSMGSSLGKLALVIAALQYYSPQPGRHARAWLIGLLVYEISFGFLTGSKAAVIMPFIIVMLCQYLRIDRASRHWFIAIPLALIISYAVVEPYRVALNANPEFKGASLTRTANTLMQSTLSSAYEAGTEEKVLLLSGKEKMALLLLHIIKRLNLTYVGSLGIAFADNNESLPAGSPEFLRNILLAPLHAWIPRFLWEGKPLGNAGMWYTQTIMGLDQITTTAMGPFTHLYFAGGIIAVFLGFLFIGFIQRVTFFVTQPWISPAGGVVFLCILSTLIVWENSFNGVIVSLFRELPLILILQFFLYKHASRIPG